jgi:hypothetical protein
MTRTKRIVLCLVAAGVVGGCRSPSAPAPVDAEPIAVWNESDTSVVVAVLGAPDRQTFAVAANSVQVLPIAADTSRVSGIDLLVDCKPAGGNSFGGSVDEWRRGGQMLIRDGAYGGWTTRLAPEWVAVALPGSACD